MKRTHKVLLLVAIFAALLSGCLLSCNNNDITKEEGTTCATRRPTFTKNIDLNGVVTMKSQFWRGVKQENDDPYTLGMNVGQLIGEVDARSILRKFGIEVTSEIKNLILFTTLKQGQQSISHNNVLGVAVFYIKNGTLNVSVYKKNANEFVRIEELEGEIKRMPVEDIRTLSLGFKSIENVIALVVNTDLSQELISTASKKSSNSFRYKLKLYTSGPASYKLEHQ